MANYKFTSFSVYVGTRRVEFQTTVSLEGDANGEMIIVDGGVAGIGSGVPTSTASFDAATCTKGKDSTQFVFDKWKAKESMKMSFGIVDGRVLTVDMWCKTISFKGDPKAGTTTFSATFQGGDIEKTG